MIEQANEISDDVCLEFNNLDRGAHYGDVQRFKDFQATTLTPDRIIGILDRRYPLQYDVVFDKFCSNRLGQLKGVVLKCGEDVLIIPKSSDRFSRYGMFLRNVVQHYPELITDGIVSLTLYHDTRKY
jgi:hypothetical protein